MSVYTINKPVTISSSDEIPESLPSQSNFVSDLEEVEVLTDADESTTDLPEPESQSEPQPGSMPVENPEDRVTPDLKAKAQIQDPLGHLEEEEIESQSDSSTSINLPLPGSEVWRDRRGFFRVESIPHPEYSEHYIRCDILPTLEQVNLAQRRIEKCSLIISSYRDHQSKSKPNSPKWTQLEKSIKSMEREIALTGRQYIELLVSTAGCQSRVKTDSEAEINHRQSTSSLANLESVDDSRLTAEQVQSDIADDPDSLTELEQLELENCEKEIESSIKSFYKMGKALQNIRSQRLYRKTHGSFADYCEDRWEIARSTAYQLIDAAVVVENVRNCGQILPANEAQARPLVKLTASQQQQAWLLVLETAPLGKVTAAHVASVVKEIKSVKQKTSSEKQQAGASLSDAGSEGGDRGETMQPEHETQQNEQYTTSDTQDAIRYNPGDLVRIQCPKGALPEQKAWDGCWAIVQSTGNISCGRVLVGGFEVNYMAGDLDWDDNSDPRFRDTCSRILALWQIELEPVEENLLKFLQHRPFFTDLEIQMISLMETRRSVN